MRDHSIEESRQYNPVLEQIRSYVCGVAAAGAMLVTLGVVAYNIYDQVTEEPLVIQTAETLDDKMDR